MSAAPKAFRGRSVSIVVLTVALNAGFRLALAPWYWPEQGRTAIVEQTDEEESHASPRTLLVQSGYKRNVARGCSWVYDVGAVNAFLGANGLRGILRAHSVQVGPSGRCLFLLHAQAFLCWVGGVLLGC